ncbi:MAG: DNA primase [Bacteroidales bacterium]|nr:DNA primase [Bacteroidales bacterium]
MIKQETINKIFEQADIVEVISDFVSLKRAGTNYKGLSPFIDEKTPSFVVSPAKGIFKDFSSGKGGNAVSFIMEHEKFSYPEALRYLAKKYNIDIEEQEEASAEEIQKRNIRESLLIVNEFAGKHFTNTLFHHAEGKNIGLSYFKERGFTEETINKFSLGYSLEERAAFSNYAVEKGYKLEYLTQTGLTISKDNYMFDRFAGRVMFPIHGLSGKIVGFGGRTLKADKKIAKYLNSPESEIYHKSNVLYGLFQAKSSIIKHNRCFMVEGYTDVLSMHQSGIENTVASSGTALTVEQIKLIKRFTKDITVIYDGDAAGIKASMRGIDLILEEGLNVKVVLLPDGEDPDSFAKSRSSQEFIDYIKENQSDFIQFKTKILIDDSKNDPVKRAQMITDIIRSISFIPDSITRSIYIKECSAMMDMGEPTLYTELNKYLSAKGGGTQQYTNYQQPRTITPVNLKPLNSKSELLEKEIIRLLFKYGTEIFEEYTDETNQTLQTTVSDFIIAEIEADELEFESEIFAFVLKEYKSVADKSEEEIQRHFTQHKIGEIQNIAADLYTSKYEMSKIWTKHDSFIETEIDKLQEIIPQTVVAYKTHKILEALKSLGQKIAVAQQSNNPEEIDKLSQQIIILNTIKQQLTLNRGKITILS